MSYRAEHHFRVSIVLLSLCGLFILSCEAQLPDGSIAPDFTATDINGVEHNLYSYLDSGYQVILEFSATWCGPCWSYHTSGVFSDLIAAYGPAGSNEIRIIMLESDNSTTAADLNGTGGNTQGDWVTGTTYDIIDNASNIFDDYQNSYYPTIYTVCPNRILTQSGQTTIAGHASIFQANNCQPATLANDAALGSYTGDGLVCGDASATLSVELQNMGLENLTSCSIKAYNNGSEIASTDWTGNLSTYAFTDVTVGNASFSSSPNLTFEITSADGNDTNNSAAGAVAVAPETTTYVQVRVTTDNWPEETGWEIVNDMGMVIESVAVGSLSSADTEFTWDVGLPGTGCYSFTMFDSYGDGLYASQWGNYQDGTAGVYGMDCEAQVDVVFEYDGASLIEFGELTVGMEAATVAGTEIDECGVCDGPGAIYECGCEDIPFGQCNCEGGSWDFNENGICDNQEVFGCTYVGAVNYLESATTDDGSCFFPCEGEVSSPSEYCLDGTLWDEALGGCVPAPDCLLASDLDANGLVGASDLLLFLTEYGASLPDADADGICDDIDTCIGIEDECGVCNGPGPTELVIENITVLYDSVYVNQIDQWFVFEVGADTTFSFTCAPLIEN